MGSGSGSPPGEAGTVGRLARFSPDPLLRFLLGLLGRLVRIRPRAPVSMHRRLVRWYTALVCRELAWHLVAAGMAVLAPLRRLGGGAGRWTRIALGAVGLGTLLELHLAVLSQRSGSSIEAALEGLEPVEGPRMPSAHFVVPPLMYVARGVHRERGLIYAEAEGRRLRLDVYRPASGPEPAEPPAAVIQVHGGGWLAGSRFEQGIPLLNHLSRIGWVGFNIDYRLAPEHTWPAQIIDVKRAIAWVRANAAELGVDPGRIAITGGSAGGHLTALAGLTANEPEFQPGFEGADTSVCAAVPFYGVYDWTDAGGHYYPELREWVLERLLLKRRLADAPELFRAGSPTHRVHAAAPPFMVIHGDRDTLVPVGDARDFVERLRAVSRNPVRYVELPGAEHAFDLWPSARSARVADGIGRFLTAVTAPQPVVA